MYRKVKDNSSVKVERELQEAGPSYCSLLKIYGELAAEICRFED